MTFLTSFIHELTQLPLASTPKHMTMVLCPLLEPIVGFLFSHTMVGKSMKVLVDMECDVLIVPPNPTLHVVLCKRTLTMSTRQKIISLKTTTGVPTPCYVSWWNNFRSGFQESQRF